MIVPNCKLDGHHILDQEACSRWPDRCNSQAHKSVDEANEALVSKCHFSDAEIDGETYKLFDNVHVESILSQLVEVSPLKSHKKP